MWERQKTGEDARKKERKCCLVGVLEPGPEEVHAADEVVPAAHAEARHELAHLAGDLAERWEKKERPSTSVDFEKKPFKKPRARESRKDRQTA